MVQDLEGFLRQAAERLAEKVRAGEEQQAPAPQPVSVRQAERVRPARVEAEPEVVDAELVAERANPAELGPNRLSRLDTRRQPIDAIDLADERMASHIASAFDEDVTRASSHRLDRLDRPNSEKEASYSEAQTLRTTPSTDSNAIKHLLRNPQTLRAVFIASEIFERKYG